MIRPLNTYCIRRIMVENLRRIAMVLSPREQRLRSMGHCHVPLQTAEEFAEVCRAKLEVERALTRCRCLVCDCSADTKRGLFSRHGVCAFCVESLRQKYSSQMAPVGSNLTAENVELVRIFVDVSEWMAYLNEDARKRGWYTTLQAEEYIENCLDAHAGVKAAGSFKAEQT